LRITNNNAVIKVVLIAIVLFLMVFIIEKSIVGFTLDNTNVNSYLTAQLTEKYGKTIIELNEIQNVTRGDTESRLYKYVCDDGENGYLVIALLKSIILNKFKPTDMFILLDKTHENYSGVLLAEGYIKTYVYDTNNKALNYIGEINKISWEVPVACGLAVLLICIIRILRIHKPQTPFI